MCLNETLLTAVLIDVDVNLGKDCPVLVAITLPPLETTINEELVVLPLTTLVTFEIAPLTTVFD